MKLVFYILLLLNSIGCTGQQLTSAEKPNVIVILTDDQGYGDITSHGNRLIETPNMDKLADAGARFENFFVSPLCAPTRASLLTGRYHLRTGTVGVSNSLEIMRSEEITMAEVFKANDYVTGIFGKWHNGEHYPNNANGQGFDEFIGFSAGHFGNYFDPTLEHNAGTIKTKGFITDIITDKAMSWIEAQKNKPFLCYIPYNAPHTPYQVPDKYYEKYRAKGYDIKTSTIYGMVENIDDNIGKLLERLKTLELEENTIIVFMTDNGPNSPHRYNAGMKGSKGSVDEGGMRVPLFIKWPRNIKPKTIINELTAHIDILPSLIDMCSLVYEPTPAHDGRSFMSLLDDHQDAWNDRVLFSHRHNGKELTAKSGTARSKQYRYVLDRNGEESLYDMINDPGQEVDIKIQQKDSFDEMRNAYYDWFDQVSYGWTRQAIIPVGYEAYPLTILQAVEVKLEGAMRFHGMGYAHDWIENWINKEDKITWQIHVVNDGQYQVYLDYICPIEDIGSSITLNINGQQITSTISEAYDPELYPVHDRAKRNGELEKPWKRITLGELSLTKGRQEVVLSANTKLGDQVMEVRSIRLEKL